MSTTTQSHQSISLEDLAASMGKLPIELRCAILAFCPNTILHDTKFCSDPDLARTARKALPPDMLIITSNNASETICHLNRAEAGQYKHLVLHSAPSVEKMERLFAERYPNTTGISMFHPSLNSVGEIWLAGGFVDSTQHFFRDGSASKPDPANPGEILNATEEIFDTLSNFLKMSDNGREADQANIKVHMQITEDGSGVEKFARNVDQWYPALDTTIHWDGTPRDIFRPVSKASRHCNLILPPKYSDWRKVIDLIMDIEDSANVLSFSITAWDKEETFTEVQLEWELGNASRSYRNLFRYHALEGYRRDFYVETQLDPLTMSIMRDWDFVAESSKVVDTAVDRTDSAEDTGTHQPEQMDAGHVSAV